ncbi:hypothetical protein GF376_00455 [Candidatus Peregrinibacteria bacterium]|nr:hypothetical protein [Candidatus Peregrinibacteria bacterium]
MEIISKLSWKKIVFIGIAVLVSQALLLFLLSLDNLTFFEIGTIIFIILSIYKLEYGLFAIIFLPIFGELSRINLLGQSIILADFLIPLYLLIWFIKSPKKFNLSRQTQAIIGIVLVFITLAGISLIINLNNIPINESFKGSLYLIRFIFYASLFPITLSFLKNKSITQKVFKIVILSTTLIAITGLIQLQVLPDLRDLTEFGYDPHINRLVGSWLDPNFIGGFFAFIITILSGLFFYFKKRKQRIIIVSIILFLLIATFLTYSRSAYVALATGFLIIGLLKSRKLLISIIILATIGISFSDRAQQRVGELYTSATSIIFNTAVNPDPTARLRIQNWEQTISLIKEKPFFGHGYNNLSFVKLEKGFVKSEEINSASGSDSSFLTILATTGIMGLIAYLLIYLQSVILAFKNWLNKKNSPTFQGFSLGIFAAIPSLIINSVFVNSLLFPQILIFFWILLALFHYNLNKPPQSQL